MDFFSKLIPRYERLKLALLKAQTFDPRHFGFPPIYYDIMETDETRIAAFREAFRDHDFRDKIVCEAGVGRLALTRFYLPFVKRAYLIENNPALRDELEKWQRDSPHGHKVTLIFGDARKVALPEAVDVLIGEMMSIFAIDEHQVPVFQHLRSFLSPDGRLFPERIINVLQLARADFPEGIEQYPINFSRHLPEMLSLPVVVQTIDLYRETETGLSVNLSILPLLDGRCNACYLRSYVQISPGHNFTGTDSLMPPTLVKLSTTSSVQAGKAIKLNVSYEYGGGISSARFQLLP